MKFEYRECLFCDKGASEESFCVINLPYIYICYLKLHVKIWRSLFALCLMCKLLFKNNASKSIFHTFEVLMTSDFGASHKFRETHLLIYINCTSWMQQLGAHILCTDTEYIFDKYITPGYRQHCVIYL